MSQHRIEPLTKNTPGPMLLICHLLIFFPVFMIVSWNWHGFIPLVSSVPQWLGVGTPPGGGLQRTSESAEVEL